MSALFYQENMSLFLYDEFNKNNGEAELFDHNHKYGLKDKPSITEKNMLTFTKRYSKKLFVQRQEYQQTFQPHFIDHTLIKKNHFDGILYHGYQKTLLQKQKDKFYELENPYKPKEGHHLDYHQDASGKRPFQPVMLNEVQNLLDDDYKYWKMGIFKGKGSRKLIKAIDS